MREGCFGLEADVLFRGLATHEDQAWIAFRLSDRNLAAEEPIHFGRWAHARASIEIHAPGTGRHSMTSTASPGKMEKWGWFSNSLAAAACDSADTTT